MKNEVDDGIFEYMKKEYSIDYNAICSSGFSIGDLIEDNKKCYYFYENENNGNETEIVFKAPNEESDGDDSDEERQGSESAVGGSNTQDSLDGDTKNGPYGHFINSENTSSTTHNTEAAAFSIVNVKNLIIEIKTNGNAYFEDYLRDVVFNYLNEMIPSTAILGYEFVGGLNSHMPSTYESIKPDANVITDSIVADGVIIDDDSTYFIEQ